MPQDALTYKYLSAELNDRLSGGRIEKISMPLPHTAVLKITRGKAADFLLISANPSKPAIYLTKESFENPITAPSFLMSLRKNIGGGRILKIEQEPFERVIRIFTEAKNELAVTRSAVLTAELMGKHSNIILCDGGGKILESIKHVTPDLSSKRIVLPGAKYFFPPAQGKAVCDSASEVAAALRGGGFSGSSLNGYILKNVSGLAKQSVDEAVFRAFSGVVKNPDALTDGDCEKIARELVVLHNAEAKRPCVLYKDGKAADFFFTPYASAKCGEYKFFDSLNEAANAYYASAFAANPLGVRAQKLAAAVKTAANRCEKRLAALTEKRAEANDADTDRLFGELLTANIYRLKKGQVSAELENYYSESGETVKIALDEKLSPQANAQKYYKVYNKKKRAAEYADAETQRVSDALEYAESLLLSIALSESPEILSEIESEIESQTVLPFLKIGKAANKNKSGRGGKKQPAKSEPLKITLNGYNIYAGKNNAQNELLTKRARGYDVWLHAKNIHGCHVVIENNQKSGFPPDEVLLRAASLAAGRSKAAGADKVPVDYTFAKNVTKPNGAPLGKVIYTGQYTVFVKPESV